MDNKTYIYEKGNPWQKKVYKAMADYLSGLGVIKFGISSMGNKYKHFLTKSQSNLNFITDDIYKDTLQRFEKHKAGDLTRILTNTASSQAYCFNLVIYLNSNKHIANSLFSNLLGKDVKVVHIEPEFTPNMCNSVDGFETSFDESIGDQNLKAGRGTDADIAIFYKYDNTKKGVLLIEFKFIEGEFSICSSYKSKNETKKDLKKICTTNDYYKTLIESKDLKCGYNKYLNWTLTNKSSVMDIEKVRGFGKCPFRLGLNQLWRNILLAEQVSKSRKCDEFGFWVFSPKENKEYLWKKGNNEKEFREVLTEQGNESFKNIGLEDVLDKLDVYVKTEEDIYWLNQLNNKYRI